jgi:hypothetical protein
MALAIWQQTITDEVGDKQPSAVIQVWREVDGRLASLFANREGSAVKGNPFSADENGFGFFYAVGTAGGYKITATKGALTKTWRNVAIGTNAEVDAGAVFVGQGAWSAVVTYSIGDMVSYQDVSEPYAFVSNINLNLNNQPVLLGDPPRGESSAEWTVLGLIESPEIFILAFTIAGEPSVGEYIDGYVFTDSVQFPEDFSRSEAEARIGATANATFTVLVNGVDSGGSITFPAGETVGEFSLATPLTIAIGDTMDLQAPSPADATLSGIKISLRGG